MELTNLGVLEVQCFDRDISDIQISCKVRSDNSVAAEEIHNKTATEIGLLPSSQTYFSLVKGLKCPSQRFKNTDFIPYPFTDLAFVKWTFSENEEKKLFTDPIAVRLLQCQAQHDIQSGKLKPPQHINETLEDCMDPKFSASPQYVSLCQTLPYYFSAVCHDCRINQGQSQIPVTGENPSVTLLLSANGIQIHTEETRYGLNWSQIKGWSCDKKHQSVAFDYHDRHQSSSRLHLISHQASYILSLILEFVKVAQKDDGPKFYSGMLRKSELWIEWDNALFNAGQTVTLEEGTVDLTLV